MTSFDVQLYKYTELKLSKNPIGYDTVAPEIFALVSKPKIDSSEAVSKCSTMTFKPLPSPKV